MKKSVPFIVGNWKLNPVSLAEATTLAANVAKKSKKIEEPYIAIAPGAPYLVEVQKKIAKTPVLLAAQDVSTVSVGAATGEVSILQLKDIGVQYVIIGHSERRAMGESDESINQKTKVILKNRLTPIVCIGEKKRDEKGDFLSYVDDQIVALTKDLTAAEVKKLVIAYEPIWAIGTGETATVEDVKEMQLFIESAVTRLYDRKVAKGMRLLYGGSVKPHNAAELQQGGGMQGFLVGGASLKAEDFMGIISAVSN